MTCLHPLKRQTMKNNNEVQLKDFPSYTIDVETGKVYSYNGVRKREVQLYTRKDTYQDGIVSVCLSVKGRSKNVTQARLIAAAKYNCSYYALPKDVLFSWTREGGLVKRDRAEAGRLGEQERMRHKEDRLAVLERTLQEIELIRQAYTGDFTPLIEYLYKIKPIFVEKISKSRLSEGLRANGGVIDIVDDAIMYTIEKIRKGDSCLILVEPYIVKVGLSFCKAEHQRRNQLRDIDTIYNV